MANLEALEASYLAAQELVGKAGDVVRSLKASLKEGKAERVRAKAKPEPHVTRLHGVVMSWG